MAAVRNGTRRAIITPFGPIQIKTKIRDRSKQGIKLTVSSSFLPKNITIQSSLRVFYQNIQNDLSLSLTLLVNSHQLPPALEDL